MIKLLIILVLASVGIARPLEQVKMTVNYAKSMTRRVCVIANANYYPIGTMMYIRGYGWLEVMSDNIFFAHNEIAITKHYTKFRGRSWPAEEKIVLIYRREKK